MDIKVDIKGLKKVLKDLKELGQDAEIAIAGTTQAAAQSIVFDAKAKAPVNKNPNITGGTLRQSIYAFEFDPLNYIVRANSHYAPYVEFGTGGKVDVPSELKELAIQFKGKGVKQINLRPQPFLYPAFVKGRKQYIKDLKSDLKRLTKK